MCSGFALVAFAEKSFGMCDDHGEEVNLVCENSLAGVVIDRFGHDVLLVPTDKDHFKSRVIVSVSPPFFDWVNKISTGILIGGLGRVKLEYKEYL